MAIEVRIPTILRTYTGGAKSVEVIQLFDPPDQLFRESAEPVTQ